MNVGNSVRKAIDDWEANELDAAMLHACNAIDGTAKKVYPKLGSNARFTQLLRDNYQILGPMGFPGINLVETRFPIKVERPKALGGKPDLADVIYGIHRCSHGHGDELPGGFALIPDARGQAGYTRVKIERGAIQLSDRIIFGLIAVAVMSPENRGQSVPDGYHLTFGTAAEKLMINDWWGRAADFPAMAAKEPMPSGHDGFRRVDERCLARHCPTTRSSRRTRRAGRSDRPIPRTIHVRCRLSRRAVLAALSADPD